MNSPAAATKDVQNRAARRIHDFLTLQQERRQLQEEKDCNETTAPNSSSSSSSNKNNNNNVLQFIQAKRRIRELEEANQELVDRDLQHQNKHLYNVRRILALRKDRCDQKFAIQKLEKTIAELEWKGTEQEQQRKDMQERTRLQISSVETKIQQLEQMVESQTSMVWKLEAENESYKIRRFKDAQTIFYLKNTERSQQKVIAKVRRQMDSMMDAIYVLITHGAGGPNRPHQQLQQHHEEEEEDGDDDEDNEEDTDEDESVEELVEDNDEDEDDIVEEVVDEEDDDEEEEENEETGPSEEFTCPLTRDVFVEPVIDAEGNTYERDAILEWLQHNDTSPITRNQLAEHHLVPNRVLKNLIAALAYHHRHSNITTTTTATISSSTTSSSSSTSSSDSSTSSDSL